MKIRQYKATGRKNGPVLECRAATALTTVKTFLDSTDEEYDYVFFDLPGTTATKGVLPLIAGLERIFIPLKADKMIMESSVTFARTIAESFIPSEKSEIKGVHLFWSMIDRRERTPLYDLYEKALAAFGLPMMQTNIPQRLRFSKELRPEGGAICRSTLFPGERSFVAECCLDSLCAEICKIVEEE